MVWLLRLLKNIRPCWQEKWTVEMSSGAYCATESSEKTPNAEVKDLASGPSSCMSFEA